MIAATVASMIPSFLPKKEQQAQDVIDQTGSNYFRRQTWRTGNRAGSISHGNHKQSNPYGKIELDPQNAKNGIWIKSCLRNHHKTFGLTTFWHIGKR